MQGTEYGTVKRETRLSCVDQSAVTSRRTRARPRPRDEKRACATKGMYSSIEQKSFTFHTNTCFYIGRLLSQRARRTAHAQWAGSES